MKVIKILSLITYTLIVFIFGMMISEFTGYSIYIGFSYGLFIGLIFGIFITSFIVAFTEWIYNNNFKWLDVFLKFGNDYKKKDGEI